MSRNPDPPGDDRTRGTPRGRLAFWENKIPHWGVCLRPDGCTRKIGHTGGSEEEARSRGEAEEEGLRGGALRVKADSSTKAPPPRAGRGTGKERRSRGPGGFKFKATVRVCSTTTSPTCRIILQNRGFAPHLVQNMSETRDGPPTEEPGPAIWLESDHDPKHPPSFRGTSRGTKQSFQGR